MTTVLLAQFLESNLSSIIISDEAGEITKSVHTKIKFKNIFIFITNNHLM